jgi:hypothetical protein
MAVGATTVISNSPDMMGQTSGHVLRATFVEHGLAKLDDQAIRKADMAGDLPAFFVNKRSGWQTGKSWVSPFGLNPGYVLGQAGAGYSGFSEEDLPSNIIGFWIAMEMGKGISYEEAVGRVRAICGAVGRDKPCRSG